MTDSIEQILHDLRYEESPLSTSRHLCDCGRAWTRRYGCTICLNEELRRLQEKRDGAN